jgi:hypothetical protein
MTEQDINTLSMQQIKYSLTMNSDQRRALLSEITCIDATVSKLKERQRELLTGRSVGGCE